MWRVDWQPKCACMFVSVFIVWQIFRIGTVRYAKGLWCMRRHGPVIVHCTYSEYFPIVLLCVLCFLCFYRFSLYWSSVLLFNFCILCMGIVAWNKTMEWNGMINTCQLFMSKKNAHPASLSWLPSSLWNSAMSTSRSVVAIELNCCNNCESTSPSTSISAVWTRAMFQ